MFTWEMRRDAVTVAVWEIWTRNGAGLDQDEREQTGKSAAAAVANAHQDEMTDEDWQHAALDLLKGSAHDPA